MSQELIALYIIGSIYNDKIYKRHRGIVSSRCRTAVWGVEGKQIGNMDEEPQVRGFYNITFICTPTNQETVSVLEKTQASKTFRT